MRIRRNKAPAGRQRMRPEPAAQPPVTPAHGYGTTGRRRNLREQAEAAASEEVTKRGSASKNALRARAASTFWLQRVGVVVLSIAVLASVINSVTLSTNPKIVTLGDTSGSLLQAPSVYQQAATDILASSPFNKNKITVNASEVSRKLEAKFPELSRVSVTVPLLAHRPVVYIQPAQPGLILQAQNGTFLLDDSGTAIRRGSSSSSFGAIDVPVVTDKSGLAITMNKSALPAEDVAFIQEVRTQLAAKQFTVTTITLPPAASQVDVALEGKPYIVKFNLQHDTARQQAGTFLATINRLQQQNQIPAQYIDVRVDGRAYYQ